MSRLWLWLWLWTADGLAYTDAKDARGWYWASGLTIGPDGTAYLRVFGGSVTWRPAMCAR